ncbi:MAG: hypothetical protein EBU08_10235 [Micrococcales bacterium]|jgi:hypothetical protein|nr:hypothetical protein [Microbacteriaceae bacterium]NBR24129.1 hypothetical protein [Micrococcales bacterium]
MEIQISEKFSHIQVINPHSDSVTVQCALWPSWSELFEATKEKLTFAQLKELEVLFRSEDQSREFEIEDQILKIRLTESVSI